MIRYTTTLYFLFELGDAYGREFLYFAPFEWCVKKYINRVYKISTPKEELIEALSLYSEFLNISKNGIMEDNIKCMDVLNYLYSKDSKLYSSALKEFMNLKRGN